MSDDGTMTYFAKIGLDPSEFLNGLSKSQGGMLAFARDVTVTMNMTMEIFDKVISQVKKFGQMANDLRDLSYTTGITTDKLQQLHYAATLSGTSVYTVDSALNKLTLSMNEAGDATSAASKAFARMGVNPAGKTPDQVFEETAFALTNMKSETDRNAAAMDIYGKSWKDLLPYMQTYIEKSAEIKANPILTDKELEDLESANREWEKLSDKLTIYSGKTLAFINDVQNRMNQYNPIWRLLNPDAPAAGEHVKARSFELPIVAAAKAGTPEVEKLITSVDKLNTASTAAAKSTAAIWDLKSVVGTEGSEMQLFMQREMEAGTSYQDALNNWGQGAPTRTTPGEGTLGAVSDKGAGKGKSSLGAVTKAETKVVETETKAQAEAFKTLNTTIIDGWIDLEAKGLIHYTALGEESRIRSQAELEYMAACVNFGGANPIIQNKIVMSKNGPDWTPPAFVAVTAPVLAAADFSGVVMLGSPKKDDTGKKEGEGGNTFNQVNNITINGVKDADSMNKQLGTTVALKGGLP